MSEVLFISVLVPKIRAVYEIILACKYYTNCVSLTVICVSLNLKLCIFEVDCEENYLCTGTCNIFSVFTLKCMNWDDGQERSPVFRQSIKA